MNITLNEIKIFRIFSFYLAAPLWNFEDMTWRTGDSSDIFSQDNGTYPTEGYIHYSNFPLEVSKRFPMYGTTDINTSNNNTVSLPRKMTSYMIRETLQGLDRELIGWRYISSGRYLGPLYGEMDLYQKVFSKGLYYIDNISSMLLFSDIVERK